MPHTIRLRGPWQLKTADSETTVELPIAHAQAASASRPISLQRSFNTPTGLAPTTRIDVVIGSVAQPAGISLNGKPLNEAAAVSTEWRAEISRQLQSRNLLSIEFGESINGSDGDAILLDDVRLEIHDD